MAINPNAKIGSGVEFGEGVIIEEGVEIGDKVQIGNRVTLRNCRIGSGVRIEDNSIIGYATRTGGFSHKLDGYTQREPAIIGEGTLIRTGALIYQSVTIGKNSWINHSAVLREHTRIGDHTCIGTMSDSEGYNTIGNHVLIHSQVHLCARMTVEDYVFIAPFCVFANGNPMGYARPHIEVPEEGPIIRFGVQMGVNASVMPRVVVGYEAIIAPSTVVHKDVAPLSVMAGVPARKLKTVAPELRMPLNVRHQYYQGSDDPPGVAEAGVLKK